MERGLTCRMAASPYPVYKIRLVQKRKKAILADGLST